MTLKAREVTIWYLEMTDPAKLRPSYCNNPYLTVQQAEVPSPELSRFLYSAVGGEWYWNDRLSWSYAQWMQYLDRPEVQTWIAYVRGTPAGYVELHAQQQGSERHVEIAYFGLLKAFIGQRIGGHLLTVGIEQAWNMGGDRVWVHTCNLDSPYALKNYQARGLQLYDEQRYMTLLPEHPVGPWPGAYPAP